MSKTRYGIVICLLLFGGCRPASDGLTDTGRVLLRGLAGAKLGVVAVQDANIAYMERNAVGPTVVLLHGFASEKDSWLRFLRKIPKDYRIVALDLPGHGSSSRDADRVYDMDTMVELVESAIHALTEEPAHIVGTSLGGMIATLYTSRNLERVRTLALYAPAGVYPPHPSEFQLLLDQGENPLIAYSRQDFDRLMDIVFFDPPPLVWPIGAAIRHYAIERAPFHQKIWNDIWPDHPTLDELLPGIAVPVLLVWGKNDRVLDVSSTEVFARLLPRVETVVVDRLGHATVNEKPAEMARLQRDFLQRHAAGSN
ncbi:MAG: alpha/beta hydrolase [Gammaproteobacteria bacterium]|nr:alpha/beta hydrolase [Gammaproteobacteria bacterium]MDH3769202.1 alpha/beta hydrolase [Gammaproteobacteria bacterium]